MRLRRSIIPIIFFVGFVAGLPACGGGSEEEVLSLAFVNITEPEDGFTTSNDTKYIAVTVGMRDGSYPTDTVYWIVTNPSGTTSGSKGLTNTVCILACVGATWFDIPLFRGENKLTVQYLDGTKSIIIIRYPRVNISGKVAEITGELVPYPLITISGTVNYSFRPKTGEFRYTLIDGSYSLSASLVQPQSSTCFSFTPSNYSFEVNLYDDVTGLDFVATPLATCFAISGNVTFPSYVSYWGIDLILTDTYNNSYKINPDEFGNYNFPHLARGTYTVTPDRYPGSFTPISTTIEITDNNISAVNFNFD